jgi:hypothetical protein
VTLVYLAHPYGGFLGNLARARRWLRWAWQNHPEYNFLAPWIDACFCLPETPENRAQGLAFGTQIVGLCDELWLVGGAISVGMRAEMQAAKRVVDLTHLGPEPPGWTRLSLGGGRREGR